MRIDAFNIYINNINIFFIFETETTNFVKFILGSERMVLTASR
jgi:hypothetical protein